MKSLFPLMLLLLFACSSPQEWDVKKATETIFSPDELQFRKFEVGMSRMEFDAAYTGDAIYGNEMEVIDSLTVSEGVYCETAFRFKEGNLSEISVQLVIDDEKKKDELLISLEKKFDEDYGKGIEEKGQFYWRAEGGLVTTDIFLTDHSSANPKKNGAKFVISLYYTAGTMLS